MKHYWLENKNRNKLILFFAGWGQEEIPFRNIESKEYDVLMFYAYNSNSEVFDFNQLKHQYDDIQLISWSFGVWVASHKLSNSTIKINKSIAINGTLKPVDDEFGIPKKIYQLTHEKFSEKVASAFYKKMCLGSSSAKQYLKTTPQREMDDLKDELIYLEDYYNKNKETGELSYDVAFISENDLIFPTKNQTNFWNNQTKTRIKFNNEASHFVFYEWESWDTLLNFMN